MIRLRNAALDLLIEINGAFQRSSGRIEVSLQSV